MYISSLNKHLSMYKSLERPINQSVETYSIYIFRVWNSISAG